MKALALLAMAAPVERPDDGAGAIAAAKAGDLAVFESLMRQHQRLVLVTAVRLLGKLEDAQDASQEVFLRLYRNLGKIGAVENVTGWLYRVTVNVCHDMTRKRPAQVGVDEIPELVDTGADPQQSATRAERQRALRMSLRFLSEKERAAPFMNCQEWEERIALYAARDAAPGEAAETERHIAGCAGCQVFSSGMKQSLEWLREAHQEEIAPAHYAAVRARVMAELERGRAPWWRQVWVYGVGLAAVAVLVMMVRPHAETARVAMVMPAAVVESAADAGQGAGSRPGGLPHREVGRRKRLPHHQPETVLVKLETDNPDVVIYWMAEKKGD